MSQVRFKLGSNYDVSKYNAATDAGIIFFDSAQPAIYLNGDKYTYTEAKAAIGSLSDLTTADKSNLVAAINAVQSAVNTLNGNDTTTGSVAKAVKDLEDAFAATTGASKIGIADKANVFSASNVEDALSELRDAVDVVYSLSAVTVEKLTTAEPGFTSSYVVKQDGQPVGATINIPKDFVIRDA